MTSATCCPARIIARARIAERDAYSHADRLLATPRGQAFIAAYHERLAQPFVGVTCDGQVVPNLYTRQDNDAPVETMVAAARHLLHVCSDAERAQLRFAIDAPNWRMWSNPELYINRYGLRMDELSESLRDAIAEALSNCVIGSLVAARWLREPVRLQLRCEDEQ